MRTSSNKVPKSIIKELKSQNIESARASEGGFVDNLFPPNQESLFNTSKEVGDAPIVTVPKFAKDKKKQLYTQADFARREERYLWSKLAEITRISRLNILKETRDIKNDVVQGELGDNYFLSILIALAQYKRYVKELVDPNAKASDTALQSNVYIHGEPLSVVIDDCFPITSSNRLAFAGINEASGNIWPAILEKAWAKCNKNYENIIEGGSADALEFLTPAPIDTFIHGKDDNELLIESIKKALKKDLLVFADVVPDPESHLKKLSDLGLISNNAYLIIDTAKVQNPNGDDIVLLKMKNLLGINEWTGDWSDNSLKWTKENINAVNLKRKEDGVFWMSFNDYLQFYTNTYICHLFPDYNYVCVKNKYNGAKSTANASKVEVTKSGSGYFIVNQKSTRVYRKLKKPEYENPYCSMLVFRETPEGIELIGGDCGKKDRLYVECPNMIEGKYIIEVSFPKSKQDFSISKDIETIEKKINYRVSVYSNVEGLTIENLGKNSYKNTIYKLIANEAENSGNKYEYAVEGEPNSFRIIKFDVDNKGHGYIYYENNSDAYLKERLSFLKIKNIDIVPLLEDGYFIQEERPKMSQRYSKDSRASKKSGPNIPVESEEVEYESNTVSSVINSLKGMKLRSTYDIIPDGQYPLVMQFNIAPHSTGTILLKKTDNDVDLDFDTETCFDYLSNIFFGEQKFPQKKFRLRYGERPVEVYECVTDHNTGVFFQYKNRTNELRVTINVKFNKFDNLYLNLCSSDMDRDGGIDFKKYAEGKFREDSDENSVMLIVNPGETGFFGLSAIDVFKKFGYSCDFDYNFSLAKTPVETPTEERSKRSSRAGTRRNKGY